MKKQEIYDAWKEKKRHINISQTFTDDVMNQISQYERQKAKPSFSFQWFYNLISNNPLAQAALVITGVIIGLFRFMFVLGVLLRT